MKLIQIQRYIKDRLLIAVSGGKDSVVLLDVLFKAGFEIGIAHCNFQLRGEESEGDEAFVRDLAEKYNLPIFVIRFQTEEYASEKGVSIQIAARELRYAWFADILEIEKYDCLLTAHHLNDNIETILHRWVRGTGIVGLQGIPVDVPFGVGKRLVRPFLQITQAEIGQYAQENALAWREDSSNAKDKYTRNLLRHQAIPILKTINPNFEQTFLTTLERLKGYASHFQASLENLKAQTISEKNKAIYIQIQPFLTEVAGKTFLAELLQTYHFLYENTQKIWEKMSENAIGVLFFSISHSLVVDRECLVVAPLEANEKEVYYLAYEQSCLRTKDFCLNIQIKKDILEKKFLHNDLTIAKFDLEKLNFPLTLRKWVVGDAFRPLGMDGKRKKISDFLNDQKVPRNLKTNVWVLCANDEIIWVVGYRIAHQFAITTYTKSILEIKISTNT